MELRILQDGRAGVQQLPRPFNLADGACVINRLRPAAAARTTAPERRAARRPTLRTFS
jgi:hypothetical protein